MAGPRWQDFSPGCRSAGLAAIEVCRRDGDPIDFQARTDCDLRIKLLKNLETEEREIFPSVLTMRSSERVGSRLLGATWALVGTTVGPVLSTVALVVVTLAHR
jgi:hypothetical protein